MFQSQLFNPYQPASALIFVPQQSDFPNVLMANSSRLSQSRFLSSSNLPRVYAIRVFGNASSLSRKPGVLSLVTCGKAGVIVMLVKFSFGPLVVNSSYCSRLPSTLHCDFSFLSSNSILPTPLRVSGSTSWLSIVHCESSPQIGTHDYQHLLTFAEELAYSHARPQQSRQALSCGRPVC